MVINKLKRVRVTDEFIVMGLLSSHDYQYTLAVYIDLPADVQLIKILPDDLGTQSHIFVLWSSEWPELKPGEIIPFITPRYTRLTRGSNPPISQNWLSRILAGVRDGNWKWDALVNAAACSHPQIHLVREGQFRLGDPPDEIIRCPDCGAEIDL
jgi:hypothetical protein